MRIKLLVSVIIGLTFVSDAIAQEMNTGYSITLQIENLKNDKGEVAINLFDNEDGFPSDFKKASMHNSFAINLDEPFFKFDNIPAGNYAISVMHDENANKKLDKNYFGKPKEGYAVSNNAKASAFGPPKYKAAAFTLSPGDTTLVLQLRY